MRNALRLLIGLVLGVLIVTSCSHMYQGGDPIGFASCDVTNGTSHGWVSSTTVIDDIREAQVVAWHEEAHTAWINEKFGDCRRYLAAAAVNPTLQIDNEINAYCAGVFHGVRLGYYETIYAGLHDSAARLYGHEAREKLSMTYQEVLDLLKETCEY